MISVKAYWNEQDVARLYELIEKGLTHPQIAEAMGRTVSSIKSKVTRNDGVNTLRWAEDDLRVLREMFDAGKRDAEIGKALNRGSGAVGSKRNDLGLYFPPSRPVKPIPDDFATIAPGKNNAQLRAHYGVGDKPVKRWRDLTGIEYVKPLVPPHMMRVNRPVMHRKVANFKPKGIAKDINRQHQSYGDASLSGRAADFLRSPKGGGWLIHRCTCTGAQMIKGDHFRVGSLILNHDDLLAMAVRKGFQVDPWKVAA